LYFHSFSGLYKCVQVEKKLKKYDAPPLKQVPTNISCWSNSFGNPFLKLKRCPKIITCDTINNKRAQRALGRSPEEKVKGQGEAIYRGPLMLSTSYW